MKPIHAFLAAMVFIASLALAKADFFKKDKILWSENEQHFVVDGRKLAVQLGFGDDNIVHWRNSIEGSTTTTKTPKEK